MRTLKTIRHGMPLLLCFLYVEHVAAVTGPADTTATSFTNVGMKEEKVSAYQHEGAAGQG